MTVLKSFTVHRQPAKSVHHAWKTYRTVRALNKSFQRHMRQKNYAADPNGYLVIHHETDRVYRVLKRRRSCPLN